MRAFLVPVIAALMLAGSIVSRGEQDTRINLKQLVQNQISQIKARGIKQELPESDKKVTAEVKTTAENSITAAETGSGNENAYLNSEDKPLTDKKEIKTPKEEKMSSNKTPSKSDDGLFLKAFILVDLSLLAALFVYWRRRRLKISTAEKAKFKKNITKLRSEGRFHRRRRTESDEVRKRLQTDPLCEVNDEAMLRQHARKLAVSQGELMLASRIRSLEKANE